MHYTTVQLHHCHGEAAKHCAITPPLARAPIHGLIRSKKHKKTTGLALRGARKIAPSRSRAICRCRINRCWWPSEPVDCGDLSLEVAGVLGGGRSRSFSLFSFVLFVSFVLSFFGVRARRPCVALNIGHAQAYGCWRRGCPAGHSIPPSSLRMPLA